MKYYSMVPKDFGENMEFRKYMLQECGEDTNVAAQVKEMCAEDLLFYVNTFCWTYDPRSKIQVTPFITYDFQDEAMMIIRDCVETGVDFAMPKSRDMGASWMGLIVFEWFWHFYPNLSFLLVSRNEDYVDKRGNPKSLFWKIDFLHKHQPRWLLPRGRHLGNKDPNRKLLHMLNAENDSVIDGESTTGDAGRGDRRTAMFIDEHAAFELNDGFRILKATRDTSDCRGFNSTPQGSNNGFHKVIFKTKARKIWLHWSKHPRKNKGLYKLNEVTLKVELLDDFRGVVDTIDEEGNSKKVLYPEDYSFILDRNDIKVRSPWYDLQCSRCVSKQEVAQELDIDFLGSGYPYFDPNFINLLIAKYCRPPLLVGDLEYDRNELTPKRFVENKHGKLMLWISLGEHAINPLPAKDRKFIIGCDVSAGTGASNSVASIVDRSTGEKVGVYRNPDIRPVPFTEVVISLARFFNNAYVIWDATGPTGINFTKKIVREGYSNIYYRKHETKVTRRVSAEPGYYLSTQAKESLFEDYRDDLSNQRFINRSETGMQECLQFVKTPNGVEHSMSLNSQDPSGARTAHGDEVVADALASRGLQEHMIKEQVEGPKDPVGSLAWRMRQRSKAAAGKKDALGSGW